MSCQDRVGTYEDLVIKGVLAQVFWVHNQGVIYLWSLNILGMDILGSLKNSPILISYYVP